MLPWLGLGLIHIDELAAWLYLALAATGLVATVGFAGLPSLGQGAFMSVGAFATARPRRARGLAGRWRRCRSLLPSRSPPRCSPAWRSCGCRALFVAVSTWLLTWLVALAAAEFPWLSGGSQGYVVASPLGTTAHYELALALTVVAVGLLSVFRASSAGIRLRGGRGTARRRRPCSASPATGCCSARSSSRPPSPGLPGALAVQLAGVSDPTAFGPFTSFRLLVAVLLGGASYAAAGVVGVAILGAISLARPRCGAPSRATRRPSSSRC